MIQLEVLPSGDLLSPAELELIKYSYPTQHHEHSPIPSQ